VHVVCRVMTASTSVYIHVYRVCVTFRCIRVQDMCKCDISRGKRCYKSVYIHTKCCHYWYMSDVQVHFGCQTRYPRVYIHTCECQRMSHVCCHTRVYIHVYIHTYIRKCMSCCGMTLCKCASV